MAWYNIPDTQVPFSIYVCTIYSLAYGQIQFAWAGNEHKSSAVQIVGIWVLHLQNWKLENWSRSGNLSSWSILMVRHWNYTIPYTISHMGNMAITLPRHLAIAIANENKHKASRVRPHTCSPWTKYFTKLDRWKKFKFNSILTGLCAFT